MKKVILIAVLLTFSLSGFSGQPVSYDSRYVNTDFGRRLEISTKLNNNGSKTISNIKFSIVLKNKMYDRYDYTAPIVVRNTEVKVQINPQQQSTVRFSIFPPSDPNIIISNVSVEQVIYSDGTYKNY